MKFLPGDCLKYLYAFYLRVVLFSLTLLGGCSCRGCPCVSCWIWSSRVFGLLFIHMFSTLVRLLRWCVSRSWCIVYFPLSCAQLMSLSPVAHVAVYCVPLSASLYLLVTVALSIYIRSVSLCETPSSLCGSCKLQLFVSSLCDITNPFVTAFCVFMVLWCLYLWWVEGNHRERHHSAINTNVVTSGLLISYSELMYNAIY